jgi:hypothetical protein
LFSVFFLSIYLCGHPYESSYRFGIEIFSCTMRGYHVDKKNNL